MRPRVIATIKCSALRHNLMIARKHAPNSKVLAVVKANGYGHGIVEVSKALAGADGFGVACLDEAIALREAGIQQPILLLEGPFSADELGMIADYNLSVVVHHAQQIAWLEAWRADGRCISVWAKLDTGMHRLGFSPENLSEVMIRLKQCASVKDEIALLSHLANADQPEHPLNQQQWALFSSSCIDYSGPKSIANSAALLSMPTTQGDWVRPGIMLYGCAPFVSDEASGWDLKPAMTLTASLFSIKQLKAGDAIGYGSSWQCPDDRVIGVVSVGYGDGYPRHAPSGTPVLINGCECPLVGRVSMDMICVDLTHCPTARCGDEVVLWGEGLPIEQVAAAAGTISYELLCGVTARVCFEYSDSECLS